MNLRSGNGEAREGFSRALRCEAWLGPPSWTPEFIPHLQQLALQHTRPVSEASSSSGCLISDPPASAPGKATEAGPSRTADPGSCLQPGLALALAAI